MRVLNLYAGLGGNRKLWNNVEVTAVEKNQEIAECYADRYPQDDTIVTDAHKFLLKHYEEFDFIWASPPCQSHSKMARVNHKRYGHRRYPDMSLYQEVIFLKEFYCGKYVVENVDPYYDILIPAQRIERHLFWANFRIKPFGMESCPQFIDASFETLKEWLGMDDYTSRIYVGTNHDPCQVLRNCVHPELGLHVFECMRNVDYQHKSKPSIQAGSNPIHE